MFDSVDIFTSRRNHFCTCYYWKKNEREIEMDANLSSMISVDRDTDELCYEREPDGTFSAREVSSYEGGNNTVAGAFMFEENSVTLSTNDFIPLLNTNDVVVHNGYVWRVIKVSRKKKKRFSQFSSEDLYTSYISLKR